MPLGFVVYLEQAILKESGSPADRLLMGCLLVLIWSSLRWSDALWISPIQLTEDDDLVRGVATRTKTTNRGMPFAFIKCGLVTTLRHNEFQLGDEMVESGSGSIAAHFRTVSNLST